MPRKPVKALLNEQELNDAWVSYKTDRVMAAREQLILHYQPLVHAVAKRVGVTLPAHIDDEDLVSYGFFGLFDAIEKFDLERGIKFATYASTRIRGAIIDELRSIDWIPRSVRSQVRGINQTYAALETKLQRQPTDEEMSEAMGISIAELHKNRGQQNFIHMVALDALIAPDSSTGDGEYSLVNQIQDNRTETPDRHYEAEEIKHNLARAIASIDEKELIVLTLYYYEGLTLAEIGKVLNVTESRVCQIHTLSMVNVRNALSL